MSQKNSSFSLPPAFTARDRRASLRRLRSPAINLPVSPSRPASPLLDLDALRRALAGDAALLAEISAAVAARDAERLAPIHDAPGPLLAALLLRLDPQDARKLLNDLPERPNLAVLDALNPGERARLLDADGRRRLRRLLTGANVETVADLVAGLPDALVDELLAGHAELAAIRRAIDYADETAGEAMMRRQLVAIPADWTVEQTVAEIRAHAAEITRLYVVYVVDADKKLLGYVKLRDLLLHGGAEPIGALMRVDVAAVSARSDREEAARLAERENLPAIPVVDGQNRLVGAIGANSLRAIARDEAAEDIKLLANVAPDQSIDDGPLKILRHRLPWLVSALLGAMGAGLIVGAFEEALEEAVILASLIPMVMDTAGNAGIQASTVTIEAMAKNPFRPGEIMARFFRELGGALLNGLSMGAVTALGLLVLSSLLPIDQPGRLAVTAAVTLVLIIVQAAMVGVLVPVALARLKLDPAVGTGVFITTVNDFAGITILFLVAKIFYLPHLG